MTGSGSVFRRCACRGEDGKQLGSACPKLAANGKHGSWYLQIRLPGQATPYRRGGFARKADALSALNGLRERLGRGVSAPDRQTTGEFLEAWLAGKRSLRATTRHAYAAHLRLHLIPVLGAIPLDQLRPEDVTRLVDHVLATGAGPQTARRVHATLRSALNTAVKQRRLPYNPAVHVELPEAHRPPVHPWEPDELGRFLDAAAADRLGSLFEVMVWTGLRRGEVCGLRWVDVDLERKVLRVRQQIVKLGRETLVGRPKTASGEDRVVELDEATTGTLLAHRLLQDAERDRLGAAWQDSGLVFTREDGSALHPDSVSRRFVTLARKAGLRRVRLHDLRHGHASVLLAAGVPMPVISKRLGHSSIVITNDTYSHLLEGVGRAAAEAARGIVPRSVPTPFPQGPLAVPAESRTEDIRAGQEGGAGGARTHDRRIMSPLL